MTPIPVRLLLGLLAIAVAAPRLHGENVPAVPGWGLGPFVKHPKPVLSATSDSRFQCPILGKEVRWEEQNVYNPAAVVREGKVFVFYRADDENPALKWGRTCRIGMAWSEDGTNFTRHPTPVLYPNNDEWKQYEWEGGCEDLHVIEDEDGTYYMNYTTWNGHSDTVSIASSRDLLHWKKHGPAFAKAGKVGGRSGVVVSRLVGDRLVAAKIDGKYWMYYTHPCAIAWSTNLVDWTPTGEAVWPGGGREAGAIALLRDDGILLLTQGGQHMLLACIAPRPLYVASTAEDFWADPRGEYLSAYHASEVYRLLGRKGLTDETSPPLGQALVDSDVGYHNRPGGHSVEMFDWLKFRNPWRRAECFQNPDGSYDWMKQSGQQWFLEAARRRGAERFLAFPEETVGVPVAGDGLLFASGAALGGRGDDQCDTAATWRTTIAELDQNRDGLIRREEMTPGFAFIQRPELLRALKRWPRTSTNVPPHGATCST